MASTYSALKIELIATGEQSGTWGNTTNTNLGDAALGEAITGSADVAFSSADVTVTLTNTNASQAARNLRLNLTGTSGGARNLILGSGCQIEKFYIINNGLADAVTVKNTTGSGVVVAAGKTMPVFNNGTNVVDVTTYLTSLTLGSALPIASGGTGSTSTTFVNAASNVTGTLPIANGGTGATSLAAATIATLGYTSTPTAASTTTLTASSTSNQFFTGSSTQTVVLPVASTMTLGQQFTIHNNSSGDVAIQSSGLNAVSTATANTTTVITCILTSGTDASSWDSDYTGFTTVLPIVRGGTGATTLAGANIPVVNVANTFTAQQTFSGSTSVLGQVTTSSAETTTITATAATGALTYDVSTQSVLYYTTAATNNWTMNFRMSSGTSLNTAMATGQAVTVVFAATTGATPYYPTAITIDGNAVTPKWQGGTAPTAGNASSVDVYSYTIIKTGSAAFTVLASQTQFK